MYSGSPEFESFLCEQLEKLKVDTDVFKDYVMGILQDDSASRTEKVDAVAESLQFAVEDESVAGLVPDFAAECVDKWVKEVEEVEHQKKTEQQEAALKDAVKVSTPASAPAARSPVKTQGWENPQDKALKQRLMEQFAWQVDEVVDFDENGAEMLRSSAKKDSHDPLADDLFRNDNRARVAAAQQMDRLKAKAQHEDELRRRAEQKKMEALKKEKEKNRVAKKERRAGR
ncbi:hypothetical protein TGPRC2_233850 [Toxoplasma gondii TgCatPRC2]|uniref:CCDC43 PWI-like domain-containing protein n=10 Tax=Toxoplasma gondii TaxID=5811 RepID=B9PG60_TOXGV|nr:hypothetical protein TGME49_233850 [Toxoplasma gondii ME49]EPR64611.1 hypothetical protein TGGT1_233850 [Toxoplasma gondii GT1]ESS36081.1 hypothetical protein TGVEG_233850 [Toxoplasma gondii VEG]KAF4641961.1 hypothetical protein TGRH88_077730 [Toxoplasma gondii]KFG48940.1 hypothetical protein TGDOM2_233850 [Toxoplasma gondii GAB2-2007-GAL-DOM2]KFG49866.1 hypothetical protein TGFOU_233850 [Toxoplasma gondii FOU]KFH17174.1 hypothetical protein TGMAS_233850 [Toxoplasma gondii MAS]KYK71458.1 |eukprot:XP_002368233.1 hypothetical protein TGME49_233850 [Toxoplasma gondii ME49]